MESTLLMPFNLDEFPDKIRGMFDFSTYRKGLDYYYDGRVAHITYNRQKNVWIALVEGNYLYEAKIIFDEKAGDIDYFCNCPAHETYGQCKHTVSALFEIHEELNVNPDPNRYPFLISHPYFGGKSDYRNKKVTTKLIQLFAEDQVIETIDRQAKVKKPIKVEYICKLEAAYSGHYLFNIELKVGVERTYVVKKITEFLSCLSIGRPFEFTKKFTFNPMEHVLEEKDKEIVNQLLDILKNQLFYEDFQRDEKSTDARSLPIPPHHADKLFSLLQNLPCSLDLGDQIHTQFTFSRDPLPLSFQLEKKGENYELDLASLRDFVFLPAYYYAVGESTIYKLKPKQVQYIQNFAQALGYYRDDSLIIDSGDIHSFLSHVIPGLKTLGSVLMDETVAGEIINPPLQAKLYLDEEDGRLTAKLDYHYGEFKLSPFEAESQNEKGEYILVRDIEKENSILPFLEEAQFKFNGRELYIDDDELVFQFLFELLPQLEELCEIYMTSKVRTYFLEERQYPKIHVDLESSGNLLDINFDFKDIAENDIQTILDSVVEKKKYVRISSGAFVPLDNEAFQQVSSLFEEMGLQAKDIKDGHMKLPAYRSLQVEEALKNQTGLKYNKTFRELIHDIKQPEERDYPLPKSLNATLREYQQTGFQWLKALSRYHFGGILADDMGLGKTLQSIAFILSEWEEGHGNREPAIVISPASLIYNWKSEFEKFAPNLSVLVINGTKLERAALLQNLDQVDVVVTSYPLIRQDIEFYKGYHFRVLFLDEAQAIKNHLTKTAKAVKLLNTGQVFALSGTPIENSLDELWSLFDSVMPGFFPSKKQFNNLSQEKVSRLSRPFILRRLKKDVLKELPEKIETVHTSELTKEQKELYLGYLDRIRGEAETAIATEGFQKSRIKILAGLTRLRQLCCHPSLFLENYDGESGKLIELLEIVENAIENGQRLLIFSQFSSMLKLIQEALSRSNLEAFYLDGGTPSKDRVAMAERFNQGEKEIFLISLKAGGTGLNLTGADTVILYDLWWNPAVEEQAAGRAHRIGQKKVVQVFRMIAKGTIEEKIYALQQKKKELIDNIIQPGETMLSSLNEKEIRELLSV